MYHFFSPLFPILSVNRRFSCEVVIVIIISRIDIFLSITSIRATSSIRPDQSVMKEMNSIYIVAMKKNFCSRIKLP